MSTIGFTSSVSALPPPQLYAKANQFAEEGWQSGIRNELQMQAYIVTRLKQVMPGYQETWYSSAASSATALVPLKHPDLSLSTWFAQTPVGGTLSEAGKKVAGIGDFLGVLLDPHTWIRVAEVAGGVILGYQGIKMLAREVGVSPPGIPRPRIRKGESSDE